MIVWKGWTYFLFFPFARGLFPQKDTMIDFVICTLLKIWPQISVQKKKIPVSDYSESFSLYIATISINSGNKCVKLPVSVKEAGSVQKETLHTQHALFPFRMLTLLQETFLVLTERKNSSHTLSVCSRAAKKAFTQRITN